MLEDVLHNRRWVVTDFPFRFVTAHDVFKPAAYEGIVAAFREILDRGLRETGTIGDTFTGTLKGNNAYSYIVRPSIQGALRVFLSQEWHDLVARIFRMETTGGVSLALHHHRVGGDSGRPHNDLNPGWFADVPAGTKPGTVNVHDPEANSYPLGKSYAPGVTAHETVRAIALLYYLNNPPWKPGDGGETGLYRAVSCAAEDATVRVPPRNNSLLAFECSPWSYHGYIANKVSTRDSIIMWLHRSKESVIRRWGEHSIVVWK